MQANQELVAPWTRKAARRDGLQAARVGLRFDADVSQDIRRRPR
jgi:hypothetical protein